jgi:transposase
VFFERFSGFWSQTPKLVGASVKEHSAPCFTHAAIRKKKVPATSFLTDSKMSILDKLSIFGRIDHVGRGNVMWHMHLTQAEYRALETHLLRAPSKHVYRKVLAVLAVSDGLPVSEVAKVLRVHRVTLCSWLKAYDEAHDLAALNRRYHANRPEPGSDDLSVALRKTFEKPPDAWGYLAVSWTTALLRQHVERQFGLDVSECTIARRLHSLKYVWKRPRVVLHDTRSPEIRRQLQLIREKVESLPEGCAKLFEDETDIMLFPPLRAGWFLRGKTAEVPIRGENAKRTIFGTIDVETGHRILLARGGTCAVDFQALIGLIRKGYGDRKVAVLLSGRPELSWTFPPQLPAVAAEAVLDCGAEPRPCVMAPHRDPLVLDLPEHRLDLVQLRAVRRQEV